MADTPSISQDMMSAKCTNEEYSLDIVIFCHGVKYGIYVRKTKKTMNKNEEKGFGLLAGRVLKNIREK